MHIFPASFYGYHIVDDAFGKHQALLFTVNSGLPDEKLLELCVHSGGIWLPPSTGSCYLFFKYPPALTTSLSGNLISANVSRAEYCIFEHRHTKRGNSQYKLISGSTSCFKDEPAAPQTHESEFNALLRKEWEAFDPDKRSKKPANKQARAALA